MNWIRELLKQQYREAAEGTIDDWDSGEINELGGLKFYWKPLTGHQQKGIQQMAEKSPADGIVAHVKARAMNDKGELIFKEDAHAALMRDFDFTVLSKIFFKMTGIDIDMEEEEKN